MIFYIKIIKNQSFNKSFLYVKKAIWALNIKKSVLVLLLAFDFIKSDFLNLTNFLIFLAFDRFLLFIL